MKDLIKKHWKIALLSTIVIFVTIPLILILNKGVVEQTQLQVAESSETVRELTNQYITAAVQAKLYSVFNVAILFVFPIVLSMFLVKQAKDEKPTKEIFISQAVLIVVPYIINAIILIMIKLIGGFGNYLGIVDIVKWLGTNTIFALLISAIADFVGCFTNNKLTHVLSTYVFMIVPPFIIFAFDRLFGTIIYGYISNTNSLTHVLAEWPGMKAFDVFSYEYLSNFGIAHIIIYTILIAALVYGTYKILSKEKKYNIITMIAIYSLVIILTTVFIESLCLITNIIFATFISLFLVGIVYILCIIFIKNKNVKKLAISYGIYSAIVVLFVLIVQGNIFGYETNRPDAEDVEYAIISTNNPLTTTGNVQYTEKSNIQYIIDVQKNLVDNQTTVRDSEKTYYKYYIQYVLNNGQEITRVYYLEPTYFSIYDSDEFINQRYKYILNDEYAEKITEIAVIGLYNESVFVIDIKKDEEMFNQIMNAMSSDINKQAYKNSSNEYGIYGEKEGLKCISIDLAVEGGSIEDYMTYASTNPQYELVQLVQNLIEMDSEIIVWE